MRRALSIIAVFVIAAISASSPTTAWADEPPTATETLAAETPTPAPQATAGPNPAATESATPEPTPTMGVRLLTLINEARKQEGLPPVKFDDELQEIAQLRADDMAARGYFAHEIPPEGHYFDIYIKRPWFWAAENLARHCGPLEDVFLAWMSSTKGHGESILSRCTQYVGFGYAYAEDIDRHYYVLIMIARNPVKRPRQCIPKESKPS
jgi:uncharacterized protein YkwD